jgi:hypothetical protein
VDRLWKGLYDKIEGGRCGGYILISSLYQIEGFEYTLYTFWFFRVCCWVSFVNLGEQCAVGLHL